MSILTNLFTVLNTETTMCWKWHQQLKRRPTSKTTKFWRNKSTFTFQIQAGEFQWRYETQDGTMTPEVEEVAAGLGAGWRATANFQLNTWDLSNFKQWQSDINTCVWTVSLLIRGQNPQFTSLRLSRIHVSKNVLYMCGDADGFT